jgi:hypothetical protein
VKHYLCSLVVVEETIILRDTKHQVWADGTVAEQETVLEELVAVVVVRQTFAEALR